MIGSALPAKWKPHTRQSFRLSFRSSTRCKREREHQAAQRRRAHKRSSHTRTTCKFPYRLTTGGTYLMADGSLLCRALRIQYLSHPTNHLCVASLHLYTKGRQNIYGQTSSTRVLICNTFDPTSTKHARKISRSNFQNYTDITGWCVQ